MHLQEPARHWPGEDWLGTGCLLLGLAPLGAPTQHSLEQPGVIWGRRGLPKWGSGLLHLVITGRSQRRRRAWGSAGLAHSLKPQWGEVKEEDPVSSVWGEWRTGVVSKGQTTVELLQPGQAQTPLPSGWGWSTTGQQQWH